ncbi:MAG TPA: response regulator [Candidatus Dormibacteraeota bacterium]|nr:response regulator [Candidatus Dormibacteraeota bacterium]
MSDTIAMPPTGEIEAKHTPTVYFIDDSATMREVIKIAFRRENIQVITCADAASAQAQFEEHPPDVVITDVIMPDQDGYSVCSQIKQNPQYGKTPVILMSGVVNKSVADRAVAVQADDLVRKPFQPQELIGRVKHLLAPAMPQPAASAADRPVGVPSLSSLFAAPAARVTPIVAGPVSVPPAAEPRQGEPVWPRAATETPAPTTPPAARVGGLSVELKLRAEIAHLEMLIKKLQTELQIERQYNQALELHVRTLTHTE